MTPLGWLTDTAALYARVFRRGAVLAVRNWQVGLALIVYAALFEVALVVAAPLGILGGFLIYLVMVACVSSALSLVDGVIRAGRAGFADIASGFTAYLNDLLTVGFLVFGLRLIGNLLLPRESLPWFVFELAVLVFLNAVPELIYLGRFQAAELLLASYRFIGENWIEWFPATAVLIMVVLLAAQVPPGPFGVFQAVTVGTVLAFTMIVRGLLFLELTSSSRRGREFRRRAAG